MCLLTHQTTSSYVDVLSNTSSFKHWTSPFKKNLMTFIHTNKTRHIWHLEMIIFLASKFITPSTTDLTAYFFFPIVKQCMCRKKTQGKTWKCTKTNAFLSFTLCFVLCQLLTMCFWLRLLFSTNTRYSPQFFLNFIENSIITKAWNMFFSKNNSSTTHTCIYIYIL